MLARSTANPADDFVYVRLVYDAVWAVAQAIVDEMRRPGGDIHNGAALLEAMRTETFEGVTGVVRFDGNVDRIGGYMLTELANDESTPLLVWDEFGRSFQPATASSTIDVEQYLTHSPCLAVERTEEEEALLVPTPGNIKTANGPQNRVY